MVADGLGRDRLVLDVLEGFGDLDCSISLASTDKMNGMSHIRRGNDRGTTTRGLGKSGTESRA